MIFNVWILVFFSSSFSQSSSNDIECQESYRCSQSENCEFYQEQITRIKTERKIETKNEILSTLR